MTTRQLVDHDLVAMLDTFPALLWIHGGGMANAGRK